MRYFTYIILISLFMITMHLDNKSFANDGKYYEYFSQRETPMESVVRILIAGMDNFDDNSPVSEFVGTGFSIATNEKENKSLVITNAHICEEALNYQYSFISYQKHDEVLKPNTYNAISGFGYIVDMDHSYDLCLLEVAGTIKPLDIASSKYKYSYTEEYLTIGSPEGIWPIISSGNITGIYPKSITQMYDDGEYVLLYSHLIQQGQSGSPILNKKNQVVAVMFASTDAPLGYGLAISAQDINTFIEQSEKPNYFDL